MTDAPGPRHRRSIRLPGYNYAQVGVYFVTICTYERVTRFGRIVDGQMQLNELGSIVRNQWIKITERFTNVQIDSFVVMPNHTHAVIVITEPPNVGAGFTPAQGIIPIPDACNSHDEADPREWAGASPAPTETPHDSSVPSAPPNVGAGFTPAYGSTPTVGEIVGAYKSLVFRDSLKIYKNANRTLGKLWQRNYYEYIVRSEADYQRITEYIHNNPARWELDQLYEGEPR